MKINVDDGLEQAHEAYLKEKKDTIDRLLVLKVSLLEFASNQKPLSSEITLQLIHTIDNTINFMKEREI